MTHSKFPWATHPHTPTAVFDGDGRRIIDQWVAPEDWQDIETAPMDGTNVMISEDHRESCGEAYYSVEEHRWYWANTQPGDYPDPHQPFPTHWMPLPAPPSDAPTPAPLDPETAAANAVMIAGLPGLIEALEFYRDAFRFVPKRSATGIDLSTWKPKEDLLEDCGEKARAALASIGRTM